MASMPKLKAALAGILVVLGLVTVACSGASDTTDDKFSQTWGKGYDETTCMEWSATMTDNERRVAAADMLTSARKIDKNEDLASDPLIEDFKQNVSTACEGDAGQIITGIAAAIYLIDKEHWLS